MVRSDSTAGSNAPASNVPTNAAQMQSFVAMRPRGLHVLVEQPHSCFQHVDHQRRGLGNFVRGWEGSVDADSSRLREKAQVKIALTFYGKSSGQYWRVHPPYEKDTTPDPALIVHGHSDAAHVPKHKAKCCTQHGVSFDPSIPRGPRSQNHPRAKAGEGPTLKQVLGGVRRER